jgi:hypothetical protein
MVVEPASAMQLAGNNFYLLEDCNHTEVCKPVDKQHPSYSMLVDSIIMSREGTEPESQEVLKKTSCTSCGTSCGIKADTATW